MRKTIATVSAFAALAVAGVSAGPAAADDPNVRYSQGGTLGGSNYTSCETQMKRGVLGQYGAAGYFLDGCTVTRGCPRDPHRAGGALLRRQQREPDHHVDPPRRLRHPQRAHPHLQQRGPGHRMA